MQDLPDAGAQVFAAAVAVKKRVVTPRQAVGIADTVEAGKTVFAEELQVARREGLGIEQRQFFLALVFLVEVEETRLQRLTSGAPNQSRSRSKTSPPSAEPVAMPRLGLLSSSGPAADFSWYSVVPVGRARLEKPERPAQGQRQAGFEVQAARR